ncbi:PH domain-containing protein [Streptomyces sp. NPDC086787]|uniref:PH domain-containing protein n=1 Tax=Streptomyces sp. NPDC086787 TaxID=3365759 RepID=UPI0038220312
MTTPDHQSPAPQPPAPAVKDRLYRSPMALVSGVLLLAVMGWLGIDALARGNGRTPWLALALMILAVPLVVAFTLRPAVFANDDRLRVRNPFRVIILPWGEVESLRSGYSNEVVAKSGTKYQLWSIPVSFRGRKQAARREHRAAMDVAQGRPSPTEARVRAQGDQAMDELRELLDHHNHSGAPDETGITVRWAYEIAAPVVAGAVLLAVLLAVG